MQEFLYNPWIIGIGCTLIGGFLLHKITRSSKDDAKQAIGILNEGRNNTFVDNTFDGFDIGINDRGEGTKAQGNKFYKRSR